MLHRRSDASLIYRPKTSCSCCHIHIEYHIFPKTERVGLRDTNYSQVVVVLETLLSYFVLRVYV